MKIIASCVFVAFTLTPTFALADHSGSMEDQIACTPDVYRLCSQFIPDEDNIVACLQRNKTALSSACHQVFSRPDTPNTAKPDDSDDN